MGLEDLLRSVGAVQGINREGLVSAVETYLDALRHQAKVAKSFYFGRLEEGAEDFEPPEHVDLDIDHFIWEGTGCPAIDPTLPESQFLIASAIYFSKANN